MEWTLRDLLVSLCGKVAKNLLKIEHKRYKFNEMTFVELSNGTIVQTTHITRITPFAMAIELSNGKIVGMTEQDLNMLKPKLMPKYTWMPAVLQGLMFCLIFYCPILFPSILLFPRFI